MKIGEGYKQTKKKDVDKKDKHTHAISKKKTRKATAKQTHTKNGASKKCFKRPN